jgi:hypothetical protein
MNQFALGDEVRRVHGGNGVAMSDAVPVGTLGRVVHQRTFDDGSQYVKVRFDGVGKDESYFDDYLTNIIHAQEWGARPLCRDISGPAGAYTVAAVRGGVVPMPAALTGDLAGPAPQYQFTEALTAKLAHALFEEDNAGEIARVADEGRGGIGKAEARHRLVWLAAEPQREAYMREAAALLARVGELP